MYLLRYANMYKIILRRSKCMFINGNSYFNVKEHLSFDMRVLKWYLMCECMYRYVCMYQYVYMYQYVCVCVYVYQ